MVDKSFSMNPQKKNFIFTIIGLAACLPASATSVVIGDHFDDSTVTGWAGQGNTRTFSAQNITETGTILSSEVVATQTNTHRGIVSSTSFNPDAEAGGFSMRFSVSSISGTPGANGYFIGAVGDDSVFFRDASTSNFGLTFYGQDARTASLGGFGINFGDNNGSAPSDFLLGNSNAQGDVQLTSFQDGFDASFTANPLGWSYSIDGLNDAAGTPTAFAGTGTWADAGTDFATQFGADDSWFATASLQNVAANTHTSSYDQITVTTLSAVPEPSTAGLLLIAATGLVRRRRS